MKSKNHGEIELETIFLTVGFHMLGDFYVGGGAFRYVILDMHSAGDTQLCPLHCRGVRCHKSTVKNFVNMRAGMLVGRL